MTCGKMLQFVINLYHTTSLLLVNGSRTDLFLTDIYEDLCVLVKTVLNKSENAILQLSIFCEKVLDKKYLLKLNNVSQTSSK